MHPLGTWDEGEITKKKIWAYIFPIHQYVVRWKTHVKTNVTAMIVHHENHQHHHHYNFRDLTWRGAWPLRRGKCGNKAQSKLGTELILF